MGSDKEVKRLTNGFENLIEQCPSSSVEGSAKIAWENSQHFRIDVTTGFPQNDVWGMSPEIPD